jgi:nitrite reductase/ring-hydroxylating ferredoxin subunit
MSENHNCASHGNHEQPKESFAELSRRNFLASVAIAAGSLGLTSLASSAQAASKKYRICATKDIKVGGASSFRVPAGKNMMVLITQPKAGVFRAFDQRCTHEGFAVNSIKGKDLICQAHGALFDMNTGAAKRGPARKALTRYTVTVEKKSVFITIKS